MGKIIPRTDTKSSALLEHIRRCAKEVESWPKWKKNALGIVYPKREQPMEKHQFDPTTLDHATLVETNNRLNRRCQKLESQIVKYRKRYAAVYKPAQYLLTVAEGHLRIAQDYHERLLEDWRQVYNIKPWWKRWW